jgi:hypothetical protein
MKTISDYVCHIKKGSVAISFLPPSGFKFSRVKVFINGESLEIKQDHVLRIGDVRDTLAFEGIPDDLALAITQGATLYLVLSAPPSSQPDLREVRT